ncbi:MurR/RpiR family transcriptional regulator, partial [Streptomyces sp. NPDC054940]
MPQDPHFLAPAVRRIARAESPTQVAREFALVTVPVMADAVVVYLGVRADTDSGASAAIPRQLRLTGCGFRPPRTPGSSDTAASLLAARARTLVPEMTRSMRRVAEAVVDDPAASAALSITGLAERTGTSEATVVRTARLLGYPGYAGLRAALAELADLQLAGDTEWHGASHPKLGGAMGGEARAAASVEPLGVLAKVLHQGDARSMGPEDLELETALLELLGPNPRLPGRDRVLLAPLLAERNVLGAAVFLRRPDRPVFDPDDLHLVGQLSSHVALGVAASPDPTPPEVPAGSARRAASSPPPVPREPPREQPMPGRRGGEPSAPRVLPPGRSTPTGQGAERRVPRALPPGQPMPMRREGDRLRFAGAATRRIARGIDLDEIVMGLCRATVPTFSDATLVYLRDPLPVGDERPAGPMALRLRRTDRIPQGRDFEGGFLPAYAQPEPEPTELAELSALTAELCEVRPGGALAEVLRG